MPHSLFTEGKAFARSHSRAVMKMYNMENMLHPISLKVLIANFINEHMVVTDNITVITIRFPHQSLEGGVAIKMYRRRNDIEMKKNLYLCCLCIN